MRRSCYTVKYQPNPVKFCHRVLILSWFACTWVRIYSIRHSEVTGKCTTWEETTSRPSVRLNIPPHTIGPSLQPFSHRYRVGTFRVCLWGTAKVSSALLWGSEGCWWGSEWCCWCRAIGWCWWWAIHCPKKTKQISKSIGEEVPWRGNFPVILGN